MQAYQHLSDLNFSFSIISFFLCMFVFIVDTMIAYYKYNNLQIYANKVVQHITNLKSVSLLDN